MTQKACASHGRLPSRSVVTGKLLALFQHLGLQLGPNSILKPPWMQVVFSECLGCYLAEVHMGEIVFDALEELQGDAHSAHVVSYGQVVLCGEEALVPAEQVGLHFHPLHHFSCKPFLMSILP